MQRAEVLDTAYPECFCEQWSLAERHPAPISHDEVVARILTAPDGYDEDTGSIVTTKLSDIYSQGLSVVRQGADDAEILSTIDTLTRRGAEERKLKGAIVVPAAVLRAYQDGVRWFGVYATDDQDKDFHGEILGTIPPGSNNQSKKEKSRRRYKLAEDLLQNVIFADTPHDLLVQLRLAGV